MANVVVNGAIFIIDVDLPQIALPPTSLVTLVVSSSADLVGESKKAALSGDMSGQVGVPPVVGYTYGGYVTPGVLTWDGALSGFQLSTKLDKNGSYVVVDDTNSGTVSWTITSPAMQPGSPPTPDPNFPGDYSGEWNLSSAGQTKLKTVE